jgi:hypothetical protein
MSRDIPEADWRIYRELRPRALERYCERVLNEIVGKAAQADRSFHDRYIAIYRLLRDSDETLARAFDSPRRSMAIQQIGTIAALGLLEPEELQRFSEPTRASIEFFVELINAPRERG